MKQQAKIKQAVESKLAALLNPKKKKDVDPEAYKRDMQVLSAAIKYLAVSAKIDESEWGSGLEDLDDATDDDDKNSDVSVSR